MKFIPLGLSLLAVTVLTACDNTTVPGKGTNEPATYTGSEPWYVLNALPPEAQPYGLDVYTAKCASCHGALGQGIGGNPPLKGLSPASMQQKLLELRAAKSAGKAELSDAEIASVSIYAGE